MRLKVAGHLHNIVRKSGNAFDVDGVRVDASVTSAGPARFEGRTDERRRRVFVVRDGGHVYAQIEGREYRLNVVTRVASGPGEHAAAPGELEGRRRHRPPPGVALLASWRLILFDPHPRLELDRLQLDRRR